MINNSLIRILNGKQLKIIILLAGTISIIKLQIPDPVSSFMAEVVHAPLAAWAGVEVDKPLLCLVRYLPSMPR
jgi:hypothetical protein